MIKRDWHNLYSDSWNGQITPDAYAHPAKFARGLIRRIYQHALEQGYLKPGDTVLDPFGGVVLGAIDAISLGLNWVGVELEEKFVKLGCDNIALWEHQRRGQKHIDNLPELGTATLFQGDSRYLCDVLGEAGGVVSSPPYAESLERPGGIDHEKSEHVGGPYSQMNRSDTRYGTSPGQLGAMRVVSSPPYAESVGSDDPDKRGGLYRDEKRRNDKTLTAEYGRSAGQLGRMRVVSSPPFESNNPKTDGIQGKGWYTGKDLSQGLNRLKDDYAPFVDQDNLGNSSGNDFWQAARQIMEQVAQVLPPGAVAIWVTKRFVRNKAIVEFSQQWAQLGEACGFETIEWIKAWLIEDRGKQWDLFGGLQEKQVKRSSFFRRLYENKYPENAIDWEDVIIQRRLP